MVNLTRCEFERECELKLPDQFWTYHGCDPRDYAPIDCPGCYRCKPGDSDGTNGTKPIKLHIWIYEWSIETKGARKLAAWLERAALYLEAREGG